MFYIHLLDLLLLFAMVLRDIALLNVTSCFNRQMFKFLYAYQNTVRKNYILVMQLLFISEIETAGKGV